MSEYKKRPYVMQKPEAFCEKLREDVEKEMIRMRYAGYNSYGRRRIVGDQINSRIVISGVYTGYRTESLYGEGKRDLREVVNHEVTDLGNTDIIDYLTEKGVMNSIDGLDDVINVLYEMGYDSVVWLCDTKQDIIECYPPVHGDEYEFDEYTIKDPVIISDLGKDGKLIAYIAYKSVIDWCNSQLPQTPE